MMAFALLRDAWKDMFCGFVLFGKILLFPFFVIATIAIGIFGVLEFFIFDIWLVLFELLSKDRDIKGLIRYFWD